MPAKAEATTFVHADLEVMNRKSDVRGHTEALLLCKGATQVSIYRVGCAGKGLRKSIIEALRSQFRSVVPCAPRHQRDCQKLERADACANFDLSSRTRRRQSSPMALR